MSRSVNYLNRAETVAYFDVAYMQDEADVWKWDFFIKDIIYSIIEKYPSFTKCDKWDSGEVHIFLENSFAEIGISEYCGLASLSVRLHQDLDNPYYSEDISRANLAKNQLKHYANFINEISELRRVGTFSNGESVYKHKTEA